ncbi:MAG: DUF1570 domain-containing protein [Planctomycetes bacterium]|nr:DUF1570 domain-containing protein [Planctomycetota bacterium]
MANYNAEVVQHEAGHHIHFNLGVFPRNTAELPTWAVEGLATMFEVVEGEAGASYGAINHNRLSQFRRIYGENGERIPDMRIVILNNGWWNGFPAYSMGWALNHYLSRCAKHAEAYKKWMQLLAARDDGERIEFTELQRQFEQLFGDIDDTWRQEFIDYMKTIQLKQSEVNWEP